MDKARGGVVAVSDPLESQLSGTVLFCHFSKVVSTHLWNTPKPLPTGCKWNPFIVGSGIAWGVAPLGVCCNFLGILFVYAESF